MAVPSLRSLTRGARIAMPHIESMVQQGLPTTQIQKVLTAAGLGVRRTDMLALVRYFKGVEDSSTFLRNVRDDYLPSVARIQEAITPIRNAFQVTVKVEGRFGGKGKLETVYVTVGSDELHPPQWYKELAQEVAEEEGGNYSMVVERVSTSKWLKVGPQGRV